jgi:ComF family protein
VFVAKAYIGAAKELVWRLKYSGAQAAAKIMAREMAAALPPNRDKGTIIVPVPTASSRVRQRGYDQASLLARELSKITGVPVKKLLTRLGASQQVEADRDVRRSQLQDAFIARKPRKLVDQTIVLVDDVLTTGATFESAARCLANAGATRIVGVAFASGQIDL